jgi:4-azaleucine resistance transporter AzlC
MNQVSNKTDKNTELAPKQAFWFGVMVCIPMIIGGIPFGLIFGTLATSYGLEPWVPMLMSLLVFAGSSQFVVLGLLMAGATLPVIIFTTFIVNLRHLLYAADLVKYIRHLSLPWRLVLGFGLIDEVYAATRPHYDSGKLSLSTGHYAYFGSFLSYYIVWNVSTALGIAAGEFIPELSNWGLEFAMVATFIGIIAPYLNNFAYWSVFVVSGVSAIVLVNLPNNLGMLSAALLGLLAGIISSKLSNITNSENTIKNHIAKDSDGGAL